MKKKKTLRMFHLILFVLMLMLLIPFSNGVLLPDSAAAASDLPTPCDPWKDKCPGGPWFCFTVGPLTCYLPPFDPK